MITPFVYGKEATGEYFTDREEETARLVGNFSHGINTILISPRRMGKTSLVTKAASMVDKSEILIVYVDVFMCRDEVDFCNKLSTELIKQTSTKFEEWLAMGRKFLSSLSPKFSFGTDPMNDFSISLNFDTSNPEVDKILDMPQKIANEKGKHVVVCIDEFQQIGEFRDSVRFQKIMRSHWQHHQDVSYCMFGSNRHMMIELFQNTSMPFYKFGDMIILSKIPEDKWVSFIMERFESTGKKISADYASQIVRTVDGNSAYVQQLASLVWLASNPEADDHAMEMALDLLISQNSALYEKTITDLTPCQMAYLEAMTQGVTTGFSRSEILKKYRLGTSSNIKYIQRALSEKEIIDITREGSSFLDPILPIWLKQRIFK